MSLALQRIAVTALCGMTMGPFLLRAQGKLEDYRRAEALPDKARALVVGVAGAPNWIGASERFWYSKSVKGGTQFMLVDAAAGTRKPAFDHEKLAAAIDAASGGKYTALTLPFAPRPGGRGAGAGTGAGRGAIDASSALNFTDGEQAIEFGIRTGDAGFLYKCSLTDYTCAKGAALPALPTGGRGGAPAPLDPEDPPASEMPSADVVDGIASPFPAPQQDTRPGRAQAQPRCANMPVRGARGGRAPGAAAGAEPQFCASFDGKWEALIRNFNVFLRKTGASDPPAALSTDGSEGDAYTLRSVAWSPDSRKLVAYHTRPGYDRQVHYIESSPADQVQPKHSSIFYRKPGDALDVAYPALFDIATRQETVIDRALFPNAFDITEPVWWKDSRAFTFEYNQRGHQVYRVIEVDAQTGAARALIDETVATFFYYNPLGPGLSGGRRYRRDLNDGKEIIWASERDGWEHLYLYDGATGKVKNQITRGPWLVRDVDYVDEAKRQIYFYAGGLVPGEDPYLVHYCRIDFDGTGLTRFTDAHGDHTVSFSRDRQFYVDTWQRVDLPPRSQLRRAADRAAVMDLETGDASELLRAGIRFPEVFVAKGRDGKTDIWGTIIRPTDFDPSRKYPVIENIYAGPQGSFVPKTFSAATNDNALAELGFIVVHIDGMGTSNRSKAFHDVAWKNLGDAGFADRILWHQAVAAKYPYYDLSRVGIFGTSAGGQSSLGGMLFHPEFYKVVVTNSGCHDNRMDKIWWNEQWMSWPVGPQYEASSNVVHAGKLQGRALIVVGEMDSNVDPASSLQVVNALVKAGKHFDMLYIPGQNHGVAVLADQHYRDDYFVRYLLGVAPPDWNSVR